MSNDTFIHFIVEQLTQFGEVIPRKMFGGYGLYKDSLMFGLVTKDDEVYFKADDVNRPKFEGLDLHQFKPFNNKSGMPYYYISSEILEDKDEFAAWAIDSYGAALRAQK